MNYMARLYEQYKKETRDALMKSFGYKNIMAVPKIEKIVVNCGFGRLVTEKTAEERKKTEEYICRSLALITGQKPVLKKAKKSIAAFKLRQGMVIGATVTLRRERMYDFLEKLIKLVFPRTRDFRGIDPSAVNKNGDLTIGFKEYTPFPELRPEKEKGIFGLQVIIKTNARTQQEGIALLKLLGFPFKK